MKSPYRFLDEKQCWPSMATVLCFVFSCCLCSGLLAQSSPAAGDQHGSTHQQSTGGESNAVDITPTDNQRLFELRVQSIQQRIEVLKQELSRRQAEEKNEEKATSDPGNETHAVPSKPSNSTPSTNPESHSHHQPEEHEGENKSTGASGFQLVSVPANSMELGNSLFSTGNYSQALRSYESLLQDEKNPVDRAWIKCFAANCYRLQGNVSAAEKLYREVAGARMNVYAADQAQWYLDFVGRKKQVIADLRAIDEELQSIKAAGEATNGQ